MSRLLSPRGLPALALVLVAAACQEAPVAEPIIEAPLFAEVDGGDAAAEVSAQMDAINAGLAAAGADYRVAMAEMLGHGDQMGATILQKDVGNKQLAFDFVPNDPRRSWSGAPGGSTDNITYAVDQVDAVPLSPGLSAAATNAAIDAAMATWDARQCSDLDITRVPDFGLDIGIVAFQNGLGGSPFVFGDVQFAGFSDINFAGGILGVAFTFRFIDGAGNTTDIDNNGKGDTAFREIYFDPSWQWTDGSFPGIDVESVAVHEAGHGLSQAHFGNIFVKKGVVKASPRAVMNALYQGELRDLRGTDNGGHCSNWGQWPNN